LLTYKLTGLKTKHIILLYSLGLAAVVWIFVMLVYLPQTVRNNELRAQLQLQQQQVKNIESFALAHPEADKYLAELDRRQIVADKMLPNHPELSEFVMQVERSAREAGVQVLQLKPSVPASRQGYREIPIEILIKGNFFQTANFLKKMEDGSRFTLVQNLTMHSRQGIIESKLNLAIFSFGSATAPVQPSAQGKTNKK
jgi:type IV pilus assembly protein PilO